MQCEEKSVEANRGTFGSWDLAHKLPKGINTKIFSKPFRGLVADHFQSESLNSYPRKANLSQDVPLMCPEHVNALASAELSIFTSWFGA